MCICESAIEYGVNGSKMGSTILKLTISITENNACNENKTKTF